jgi:hypothetical protein
MPTLQQLPQALIVDPQDEVLLAQDGQTKVLAVETLLAGTQPLLTLAPNQLLGRAGYFPGGPEAILVGDGMVLESGTLTADSTALAFLDSPEFTGTPTAPTPPNGDSSDNIATTAFVQANLPRVVIDGDLAGAGSGTISVSLPSVVKPGTYTGVTVNTKGLVVGGSTLTAANVETALGFTPYNATNPSNYTTATALQTYPVLAYGAYFDGVHDDAPGINAAIAAANAAGGGTVLLPAGRGLLGSTLQQQWNNIHIVGAGVANISHNTQPSYDIGTVLSWIGAIGGTMAVIAPPQDLIDGRSISNADVRGVVFDCAAAAGFGIIVASVNYSKFDVGYYQPLVCGLKVTTVLLQAQTSATAATYEVNDSQHNSFRITGFAVFYGSTTLTAAAAGATTIPVASTSSFATGQQILVGGNLYLIASVATNSLTVTSPLAAADGAVGTAVGIAPRGVWLQGLTTADFPAGYSGPGASSYPQLWNGNVSLNRFEKVVLIHYNSGTAFTFGYSDHNYVDMLNAYSLPTAFGVVFDGSHGLGQQSSWNQIGYCSTHLIAARGLATYPNASGNVANNGQYVSNNNYIGVIDTGNGTQYPTIEPGATMTWTTDTDVHLGARLVTPTIFEAAWETTNGTFVSDPNTSLTVVNNSSDHMRFCNGLGTQSWSINIGNAEGDLRVYPSGASANSMLMLGSSGSPVAVQGSLSVAGAVSVVGGMSMASAFVAGAISAGSGSVAGALATGTLSATAGLTVGGSVSIAGPLSGSAATLTGALSTGTLAVGTGLTVAGPASIAGPLTGSGAALSGALSAASGSVAGVMTVGTLSVGNGLNVAGATSLAGSLTASGVALSGAISSASGSVAGKMTVGTLSVGSGLTVGGAASVAGPLTASGAVLSGALSAASGSVLGAMSAGALSVGNGLTVGGTASVAGALVAASVASAGAFAAGSLNVSGPASVAGALAAATPAANDSSSNVATTSWVTAKAYLPQFANLAALRAVSVSAFADGKTILLDAYATRGDGGGGLFTWNASSSATDNGGTIIQPTGLSGAGRWLRQLPDGRVTPQMFGALGDGVTNDTAAFAAALATGPVIVPSATYRIANLVIPNGAWMEGGAGLGYSAMSEPRRGQDRRRPSWRRSSWRSPAPHRAS